MSDEIRTMETIEAEIRAELARLLERLPPGPAPGRLAVLVGLAVEASGAEQPDVWLAMAALVSAAHNGSPACIKVVDDDADESTGDHKVVWTFHANGQVQRDLAVAIEAEPSTRH